MCCRQQASGVGWPSCQQIRGNWWEFNLLTDDLTCSPAIISAVLKIKLDPKAFGQLVSYI